MLGTDDGKWQMEIYESEKVCDREGKGIRSERSQNTTSMLNYVRDEISSSLKLFSSQEVLACFIRRSLLLETMRLLV